MKYQISFLRLNRVHWTFCEKKETAQLLYDALIHSGNKQIEILQDPNTASAVFLKPDNDGNLIEAR